MINNRYNIVLNRPSTNMFPFPRSAYSLLVPSFSFSYSTCPPFFSQLIDSISRHSSEKLHVTVIIRKASGFIKVAKEYHWYRRSTTPKWLVSVIAARWSMFRKLKIHRRYKQESPRRRERERFGEIKRNCAETVSDGQLITIRFEGHWFFDGTEEKDNRKNTPLVTSSSFTK